MADSDLPDNSSLSLTNDLANKSAAAFSGLKDAVGGAKNVLKDLYAGLGTMNQTMQANGQLTRDQTTAFGALSVAILGTSKALDNLNNIDTTGLNTFTNQIKDLQGVFQNSPAYKIAKQQYDDLTASIMNSGKSAGWIQSALKEAGRKFRELTTDVFDTALAMAESADYGLKLQNTVVQLAARTGELGDVYATAGKNLNDINTVLQLHEDMLNASAKATGLNKEQVAKFYTELGTVPQALKATITSSENSNQSVSMLTATMQYAAGSGRKYSEIVDDLRTALNDYNLTGEKALVFTARMGELSNKFGVQLSDVRDSLRATADAFKMFGNEGEGAAAIMNDYLGALQKTGLSGQASIEVIKGLTDGIKRMDLAQKAFLSAQTGGPGGLMGAFQIEKDLREGKIDKVFEKVRQQMQKQFGKIVTLDEATQSPQAAAQLTKQIAILRQGPLGQFAKDDQSAMRLLEGFKNKDTGAIASTPLSDTGLKDTMHMGVELQKKSATELSIIRAILQGAQGKAGIINLGTIQQGFTAGTGLTSESVDTDAQAALRDNISQSMQTGAVAGGDAAKGLQTQILKDQSGSISKQMIDELIQFSSELDDAIKAPVDVVKKTFKGLQTGLPEGEAGNQLGGVTQSSVANAPKTTQSGSTTTNMPPHQVGTCAGPLGELTVHIEGYCLECGEKIKGSSQSYAVNTGQRARK